MSRPDLNSKQRPTTFGSRKSRKELDSGFEASSGIDADSESIISNDVTTEKEHKIDSNLLLKLVQEFGIESIKSTESIRSTKKQSLLRDAWSKLATKYDRMRAPNLRLYSLITLLQKYYNENNVIPLSSLKSCWTNEADNQSFSEDLEIDGLEVVGGTRGNLLLVGKENAFKK